MQNYCYLSFITAKMGKKYDIAQRVQDLTLLCMGMKIEDAGQITGF